VSALGLVVRKAELADLELVHSLILELADYEKLRDSCTGTVDELRAALFGPNPMAEVLLAFIGSEAAGMAVYFCTFSTFAVRPILHLEDLFVRSAFRRMGVGRRLIERLAVTGGDRGCAALEFSVLHWNELALGFYRSLGAAPAPEWIKHRLGPRQISALAQGCRVDEIPPEGQSRPEPDGTGEQKG
jgi:ribosomal protein S18 acetylase RimI-like enzyme